ncbi:MAG: hypothetical protein U0667_10565 [Chloroflexota bacterium]
MNTSTALGQRAVAQRRLRRSAADRAAGRRLLCTTNGCATFMSLDASGTLTCPICGNQRRYPAFAAAAH